jgi:hypothetical protein
MRTTAIALIAAVAAALAATASAAPAKGKPPVTGTNCKPSVSVILRGTLAGAGSATLPFSLSVNLTGGNKAASAWRKLNAPVSVQVTSTTRITRGTSHAPADLKAGDRVNIQARACKADTTSATLPALTAVRVVAHPAQ